MLHRIYLVHFRLHWPKEFHIVDQHIYKALLELNLGDGGSGGRRRSGIAFDWDEDLVAAIRFRGSIAAVRNAAG